MGSLTTDLVIRTEGGLWSKKVTDVRVNRLEWHTTENNNEEPVVYAAETYVKVYFDPETWNVNKDGLLYTDNAFEKGLKDEVLRLVNEGKLPANLPWKDISYTEQGMQHENYVHMILGVW